jgi:hypothetical protein
MPFGTLISSTRELIEAGHDGFGSCLYLLLIEPDDTVRTASSRHDAVTDEPSHDGNPPLAHSGRASPLEARVDNGVEFLVEL